MAKVLFVSLNDVNAEGIRIMSSILQKQGHQSFMIVLKRYTSVELNAQDIRADDWLGINLKGKNFRHARGPEITDCEKELLIGIIKKIMPDLIGLTVNAPLKSRAVAVTQWIKNECRIPIVWGGAFPTVQPELCLEFCDLVCVGEGEKAIGDIADRIDSHRDFRDVANIGYITDDQYIQNGLSPLMRELDMLPFKDISPKNKYLIENDKIIENFAETSYSKNFKYHAISSRGCVYSCSYCCENYFKRLYAPQPFLRRRSPSHVIQELKEAKQRLGYKMVQFEDEVFSFDKRWLEEFSVLYRKEIGVPFICYVYPNREIEVQLELLKDTGLVNTCLALQSGSERINKDIFHRPFDKELFYLTAEKLRSLKIDYYVDIITFNPFEKREDLEATLKILLELPKPHWLCVNKLYIVEGTDIARMVAHLSREDLEKQLPEKVTQLYARLFWLSAFTRFYKRLILAVRHRRIFEKIFCRMNPFFLNLPFYLFYLVRRAKRSRLVGRV